MSRLFNFHWKHLSEWCLWKSLWQQVLFVKSSLDSGKAFVQMESCIQWTGNKAVQTGSRFQQMGDQAVGTADKQLVNEKRLVCVFTWEVQIFCITDLFWLEIKCDLLDSYFLRFTPFKIDLFRQFYMTWFIGMVVFCWFNKYLKYMYIVVFIIVIFGCVPQS